MGPASELENCRQYDKKTKFFPRPLVLFRARRHPSRKDTLRLNVTGESAVLPKLCAPGAGSFHSGIVWGLEQLSYLAMRRVVVDLFLSKRIVPDIDLASPQDQETLKQLAQTASGLTGYIVEVTGFADSTRKRCD
jgi:hypothetical protein